MPLRLHIQTSPSAFPVHQRVRLSAHEKGTAVQLEAIDDDLAPGHGLETRWNEQIRGRIVFKHWARPAC